MSSAARDIIGPSGKLEEQWVIVPNFTYTAEWLVTVRTVGGGNPDPAVPRVRLPGEYSVDARTVRVDAFMPDWFPNFVRKTMVPPYTEDDPQKKWDYLVNMRLRDPTTAQGIYTRAESRPRSKKGFPKGHDAFMAELYRDTSKEITLKAPDGSAVWWTDLDSGPIRIATLWDLIGLHHRGQPKIEKGKALWLLSGDQWDKAEYPAPSKGGPPYIEGVSVARDPGKMPPMTAAREDYPDFEAALQAASSRFGATHVVRQGRGSAIIYSPTSKGYERRSLSCDRGFFHWPKQADLVDEVPENAERVVDVLDIGFDPDAPPRREAAPMRRAAEEAATRQTLSKFDPATVPEGTIVWLKGSSSDAIEKFLDGLEKRGLTMIYAGPGDRYQVMKNPPGLTRTSQKSLPAEEARGSDRERWEKLQAEFRRLTDEMTRVESEAHVKWGPHGLRYASRALQSKHAKLVAARSRVYEKIFAMTQKLSPRDWGTGVPTWWVAGKLTFDDLVRPIGEPLSVTPPLAYGATTPMKEGAREMGAVRETREGRHYESAQWLEFECEPATPTTELEEMAREFKKLVLEFLESYARTWSIDTGSLDEDSFVWNAYASLVGHGVGLWEGDGDTGLRGEDEKKIDKALRGRWSARGSLVGKLHELAHRISDECAMLSEGAGGREASEEASIPTKAQLKIINAFRERRLMGNPMRDSISTDGDTIYSYRMPIAGRNPRGGIWIADPKGAPSVTTRNHIYGLQRTFTPAEIAAPGQAAEARRGERVTTPHGDRFEVVEYTLPVYWASYLINGDASGLENGEQKQIDEWLEREGNPHFVDVSEDTHFAHRNDATNLGGDVATYTAHMRPGGRGTAPDSGGGVPRMQSGYAFYTPSKRKGDWKKIPNDDWEHVVVGEDEIGKSSFVGIRNIDGSMHDIFEVNFAHGRGGRGYYAQLQTHTRGRGAAHEARLLPESWNADQNLWVKIGTLSHNRDFSVQDFTDYTGRSETVLKSLVRAGLIQRVKRGQYYPTPKGWEYIEQAYGGAAHEGAVLLDHMANDFTSPKDAIMHAQSAWGATHVDFHGTRNSPTVYGTKDGARWKKTLFKEKGKFHWPDKFAKGPKRLHGAIEIPTVVVARPRLPSGYTAPELLPRGAPAPAPVSILPDDDYERHLPGQADEAQEADPRYFSRQNRKLAHVDDVFYEGKWIGWVKGPFKGARRADFFEWEIPSSSEPQPFGSSAKFGESRTRRAAFNALVRAHKTLASRSGIREARENPATDLRVGDAVQFRWEPNTGGTILAITPNGMVSVQTRDRVREVPMDALRLSRRAARENPATDLQDAIPWVRVTRDPERYKEALARATKIGPVDDAKKVYELVGPALMKEDQETFIVVLIDVRQNCRGVAEIHRGARSRVATSVLDVMRIVVAAGAEGFIVCHNHPSGKAMPSDADRSLTKAIERAAKPFSGETAFLDHVVIGAGEYFSFADNKLHRAK